ncbi:hypothetical protein O0I10_008942 [Lichtheimia ornata]|uniref:Uncharacterized protein n=1 Tax=Lichtheimia ornata TaxID=688661 RepID=A0AAD7XWE4_9FUNG|nr:uncharacterized protein O0I10_008942 [Lichtheimia ornata]KAJ8655448.1 hypothetical protein O0I10_008942 [Lichtheimia ornata]
MCLFNEAVRQHPPPGHKLVWATTLLSVWTLVGGTIYICWNYLLLRDNPYVLLIIPAIILLSTIAWIWRYRYLQRTFQCSLVELCSRVNATENIRGINYRLTKHGNDVLQPQGERPYGLFRHSTYALVIEFDDRYRALQHLHHPPASTVVPMYYTPPPPSAAHHCQHEEKRFSMHHPYDGNCSSVYYEKQ